jgi:hypothetical protein
VMNLESFPSSNLDRRSRTKCSAGIQSRDIWVYTGQRPYMPVQSYIYQYIWASYWYKMVYPISYHLYRYNGVYTGIISLIPISLLPYPASGSSSRIEGRHCCSSNTHRSTVQVFQSDRPPMSVRSFILEGKRCVPRPPA